MNRKEPFPVNLEEPAKYLGMKAAEALQQLRPVRRAGRHPYFWLFAPTQNCLLWLPEMTESAAPKKGWCGTILGCRNCANGPRRLR